MQDRALRELVDAGSFAAAHPGLWEKDKERKKKSKYAPFSGQLGRAASLEKSSMSRQGHSVDVPRLGRRHCRRQRRATRHR